MIKNKKWPRLLKAPAGGKVEHPVAQVEAVGFLYQSADRGTGRQSATSVRQVTGACVTSHPAPAASHFSLISQ